MVKEMNRIQLFLTFILLSILLSCEEGPNNIEDINIDDFNSDFGIKSFTDIGGEGTTFQFKIISTKNENSELPSDMLVRWDFDSDNTYDTEWIKSDTIAHIYNSPGKHNITAEVLLDNKHAAKFNTAVYSQPVSEIVNRGVHYVHETCFNNDETKVYFVWGSYPHQIYSIDMDNNIEYVSKDLPSENCRHYLVCSPDGKFLAYSYNSGVSLLNLETMAETEIYPTFSTLSSHSFTSDGKYFIVNDISKNGIHLININTLEDTLFISNAYQAANIPNENKIAYLTKDFVYDTTSYGYVPINIELTIYNLDTGTHDKVYKNIPYSDAFQVISGGKVIYFVSYHILYFLDTGESIKIDPNEIEVFQGWPSAISRDGRIVLLSTKNGLSKIELPDELFE